MSPWEIAVFVTGLFGSLIASAYAARRLAARQPVFEPSFVARRPVSDFAFAAVCWLLLIAFVGPFFAKEPDAAAQALTQEEIVSGLLTSLIYEIFAYGMLFLIWAFSTDPRRRPVNLRDLEGPIPEPASREPLLSKPQDLRFELKQGVLAFLLALPWVFLVYAALKYLTDDQSLHPLLEVVQKGESPLILLLVVAHAVVMAPLLEELQFRVILQGWLAEQIQPGAALVIAGGIFCLAHPLPISVALIPLALVLGRLYQRRGSYLSVVTAHLLFNLFNLAMLMSGKGTP